MQMPDFDQESFPFKDTADRLRASGMESDVANAVADEQAKVFSMTFSRVLSKRDFDEWRIRVDELLIKAVEERANVKADITVFVAEQISAAKESMLMKFRKLVSEEAGVHFEKFSERVSGLISTQKTEYQLLLANEQSAIKDEMQVLLKEMAVSLEKYFRAELQRVLDDAMKFVGERTRADLAEGLASAAERMNEILNKAMDKARDSIEAARVELGKEISKNREAIGKNSEAIVKCNEAIVKCNEAIAKNSEAIADLREDMHTMYRELRDKSDRNHNTMAAIVIGVGGVIVGVVAALISYFELQGSP